MATLTRMAGPIRAEELYELCLQALLDHEGEWAEDDADRVPLLVGLISALTWQLEDDHQRALGEWDPDVEHPTEPPKGPQLLRYDAAERVYMRAYEKAYRGDEIATGWPGALPYADVVLYPRELVARIALAMADRDNATNLQFEAYCRQQEDHA